MPQSYEEAVKLVPALKDEQQLKVERIVSFLNEKCGISRIAGQV